MKYKKRVPWFTQECRQALQERKKAQNKSNESAAGPDAVYCQFLRHLPESSLHILLKLFNNIWTTGDIPPSWREASDPSNYRPIALTSCLCKTLERMVNDRLVHVLESTNLLSKVQCGFRKDHSTLYHLRKKSLKALNLLRVVGHRDWGADRATLLKLYRTLVRSKLDYGSVVYGSSEKYVLRALDPIQHQRLGIQGNENMDKLLKVALNKASYSGKLICWSDLKPKVNAYIHTVWQENWDMREQTSSMRYSPTWEKTSTKEVKEQAENGRR
ncbi:RNA-directed DNA polymerase from mobile element jockey [Plakobranchus ocellatus]|uniref:RNA-directed DNA polymerase from mobile element jockey n=1 Tax=Plakobranchus ocellatus TaxID=259542 RepID=A0AAV3YDI2_9GAST|nr:RNA-directed DNA polymerase from mobile element jockey [Plakobranchus ocellatus]